MRRCPLATRAGTYLAGGGAGARAHLSCLLWRREIRRYQSQLWWIKSVAGQHETTVALAVWQTPLALPAGLGTAVQLRSRRQNCADREGKELRHYSVLKRGVALHYWDVTTDVN